MLIGDEDERPYDRPPLSKDYLQGKSEKEKIYVHPEAWYADNDVELLLGHRVTLVEPAGPPADRRWRRAVRLRQAAR